MSEVSHGYPRAVRSYQEDRIRRAQLELVSRLERYRSVRGDLLVPQSYIEPHTGYRLGLRVHNVRRRPDVLAADVRQRLDEMGFVWNVLDARWEANYNALSRFRDEHGHGDVPIRYVSADGLRVGTWLANIRRRLDGLSNKQERRLQFEDARLDWDQWLQEHRRRRDLDCPRCGAAGWELAQ